MHPGDRVDFLVELPAPFPSLTCLCTFRKDSSKEVMVKEDLGLLGVTNLDSKRCLGSNRQAWEVTHPEDLPDLAPSHSLVPVEFNREVVTMRCLVNNLVRIRVNLSPNKGPSVRVGTHRSALPLVSLLNSRGRRQLLSVDQEPWFSSSNDRVHRTQ